MEDSFTNEYQVLAGSAISGDDLFGYSIAMEGNDAVIGTLRGEAAYAFHLVGNEWVEEAELFTPDRKFLFGKEVAISGGVILVASERDWTIPCGGLNCATGAVHSFVRQGLSWDHQARIIPDPVEPTNNFGKALGMDGISAAISSDDDIYVYRLNDGNWTQTDHIPSQVESAQNEYTQISSIVSLALKGNVLAVSARVEPDEDGYMRGVVVYEYLDNTWVEAATLLEPRDCSHGGLFGWDLAIDGNTLVVGAPKCWNQSSESYLGGAVFLYDLDHLSVNSERLDIDLYSSEFNIYPNPTSTIQGISLDYATPGPFKIEIYDVSGRLRWAKNYTSGYDSGGQIDFSSANLASGVYVVRLLTESDVKTRKIVVVR
jgi:hypothetical protein